jgi:prophage regulatory protein
MPKDLAVALSYLSFFDLAPRGIKFTRQHIRRLIAEGEFPPARQLSSKRIGWLASEIDGWLASRPIVKPLKRERPRLLLE